MIVVMCLSFAVAHSQVIGDQEWKVVPGYYLFTETTDLCGEGWHVANEGDIHKLRQFYLGMNSYELFPVLKDGLFKFSLDGYYDANNELRRKDQGGYFWVANTADINDWKVYCAIDGPIRNGIYLRQKVDYRHSMKNRLHEFNIGCRCVKDKTDTSVHLYPNTENNYTHVGAPITMEEFFGSSFDDLQLVLNLNDRSQYLSRSSKKGLVMTFSYLEPNNVYLIWISNEFTK